MTHSLRVRLALMSLAAVLLAGCSQMPTIGPSRKEVGEAAVKPGGQAIQIVDVDDGIARRLQSQRTQRLFSDSLGSVANPAFGIGTGDAVEINYHTPGVAEVNAPRKCQTVWPKSAFKTPTKVPCNTWATPS